jgi:hypothetical protein
MASWLSTKAWAPSLVLLLGCAGTVHQEAREAGSSSRSDTAIPEALLKHDRSAEATCLALSRADELLCRADKRLMQARRNGDEASVRCYTDKGRQMRASWRSSLVNQERLKSVVDDQNGSLERERIDAAGQSLERVFGTLEDCERRKDSWSGVKVEAPNQPVKSYDIGWGT